MLKITLTPSNLTIISTPHITTTAIIAVPLIVHEIAIATAPLGRVILILIVLVECIYLIQRTTIIAIAATIVITIAMWELLVRVVIVVIIIVEVDTMERKHQVHVYILCFCMFSLLFDFVYVRVHDVKSWSRNYSVFPFLTSLSLPFTHYSYSLFKYIFICVPYRWSSVFPVPGHESIALELSGGTGRSPRCRHPLRTAEYWYQQGK